YDSRLVLVIIPGCYCAPRTLPPFPTRRSSDLNARANRELLKPVRAIAEAHGATPAQIALAWVHQQASVRQMTVVPVPGTRKRSRDRKSTRLNSSHVKISYAVFCLKKKKNE